MTRVLLVEDDTKLRATLALELREEGFQVTAVESAEAGRELLGAGEVDLLLLDIRLGGMSGVELVRELVSSSNLPTTIVISGEASISETVEALHLGVYDFIEKPFSAERLRHSVSNALEHAALRRHLSRLRQQIGQETPLLGTSAAMRSLRELIAKAAPTEARVLIRGESGTGKELVANLLHRSSRRHQGPFVKINCAAIPAALIEDELFGHLPGAFTDASTAKPGLFEEADGGTLFLDEIGDMELGLQSRLLRVLEDGRVRRLGATHEREVKVRVIAATNRNLEHEVAQRRFREDLYYRLAHLVIDVPPLRERGDDVRLLFRHFIDEVCRRHNMRRRRVEPQVIASLQRYRWPGNVRELMHVCERLVVFGADPVRVQHLPSLLFRGEPSSEAGLLRLAETVPELTLRELREQCEREYIERVLQHNGWNVSAAARTLGLQRSYLHEKMAALGLARPEPRDAE